MRTVFTLLVLTASATAASGQVCIDGICTVPSLDARAYTDPVPGIAAEYVAYGTAPVMYLSVAQGGACGAGVCAVTHSRHATVTAPRHGQHHTGPLRRVLRRGPLRRLVFRGGCR